MKQLSQTQFFVAALVLVLMLALIAILAGGLKKYDAVVYEAEQALSENEKAIPPSTPEAIIEELKMEEADASVALEAELAYETRSLEEDTTDVTTITESYE